MNIRPTPCLVALAAFCFCSGTAVHAQTLNTGVPSFAAPLPPVALDQAVRTKPTRPVWISLNASSNTIDWTNYTVVTNPAHGTLEDFGFIAYANAASPSGKIGGGGVTTGIPAIQSGFQQYTPDNGFSGTDSFTFQASNSAGESNIATVTITVTDTNLPPIAEAQLLNVKLGGKQWIYLYATDPDNDSVTCVAATQPTRGTLRTPTQADYGDWATIQGGPVTTMPIRGSTGSNDPGEILVHPFDPIPGVYIYEPDASLAPSPLPDGWSADDSFTFTANDGTAESAPATVTLHIGPPNRAPVAVLAVSPALEAWTKNDVTVVIANNNKTVDVVLDAGDSTDADNDPLWANWFERVVKGKPAANVRLASTEEAIGWGLEAPLKLTVGTHTIVAHVTDWTDESVASFSIKVISPFEAVNRLNAALRYFGAPGKIRSALSQPALKALDASRRGKFGKTVENLESFKQQVADKLAGKYPKVSADLTDMANAIIEALTAPPVVVPVIMY